MMVEISERIRQEVGIEPVDETEIDVTEGDDSLRAAEIES
jgi:hypothetical protein